MSKTTTNEVEAELKKNPGVVASLNESTGQAQAFALPVPYWVAKNDAGGTGSLTASERDALISEHDALVTALPRLKKGERSKATTRINVIEGLLRRARATEESVRRNAERTAERPAQRYGQPGNTTPAAGQPQAGAAGHTQHEEADPFKRAVENVQKAAPSEFRTAVEATRAKGGSVARAIRNMLLK